MIDVRQRLQIPSGASTTYYSFCRLETLGAGSISRLPVSARIVFESVLCHVDGRRIREEDVEALARWQPWVTRTAEVPFVVGHAETAKANCSVSQAVLGTDITLQATLAGAGR